MSTTPEQDNGPEIEALQREADFPAPYKARDVRNHAAMKRALKRAGPLPMPVTQMLAWTRLRSRLVVAASLVAVLFGGWLAVRSWFRPQYDVDALAQRHESVKKTEQSAEQKLLQIRAEEYDRLKADREKLLALQEQLDDANRVQIFTVPPPRTPSIASTEADSKGDQGGDRSGGGEEGGGQRANARGSWRMPKSSTGLAGDRPGDFFTSDLDIPFAESGRGDSYARIEDNPFRTALGDPLSTFSIDVDTASYAITRQYLTANRTVPPADAVRVEEFLNYFTYDYEPPKDKTPFAAHLEVAECPWNAAHRLVRIGLKGRNIEPAKRPPSNLVFLLDVSGSMSARNKLPLVIESLKTLVDVLNEKDRVAIVAYAGQSGEVLPSTTADRKYEIAEALNKLQSGGSTNGSGGLEMAYGVARKNLIAGGTNRVILCTDGDWNVGVTGEGALERLIEEKAKSGVFLSVYGFGMGNLQDAMLEKLSAKGNGNYGYIDSLSEARRQFVEQLSGTLVTIAKDVKIQVEFNPATVRSYRLLGYENRLLAAQDFADDTKDAGEIGAGHTVTALYEIEPVAPAKPAEESKAAPAAGERARPEVDPLRYQLPRQLTKAADSGELLMVKLRYKEPEGTESRLLTFPLRDGGQKFAQASRDFQFASSVAAFAMLLRHSPHAGGATFGLVKEIAKSTQGKPADERRAEFLELVGAAQKILGKP